MSFRKEIEALLFASSKFMSEEELSEYSGQSISKVKQALSELKEQYEKADNALSITNNANSWKMTVKDDFLPTARKIVSETELEKPVLETLAVIAWKRPILQSEVINMRGSHAYEHVKELLQIGFITREKHGRSFKLKLADKFFDYFDVEGDRDIRQMFSVVERPEPKEQKKLGKLDVVDLRKEMEAQRKADQEQHKLGQLDVVDPLEKWKVDHEELDEIDKELDKISERTDDHVKEIDKFKPEEPEEDSESKDVKEEVEEEISESKEIEETADTEPQT